VGWNEEVIKDGVVVNSGSGERVWGKGCGVQGGFGVVPVAVHMFRATS
jgi:hypothetical protein